MGMNTHGLTLPSFPCVLPRAPQMHVYNDNNIVLTGIPSEIRSRMPDLYDVGLRWYDRFVEIEDDCSHRQRVLVIQAATSKPNPEGQDTNGGARSTPDRTAAHVRALPGAAPAPAAAAGAGPASGQDQCGRARPQAERQSGWHAAAGAAGGATPKADHPDAGAPAKAYFKLDGDGFIVPIKDRQYADSKGIVRIGTYAAVLLQQQLGIRFLVREHNIMPVQLKLDGQLQPGLYGNVKVMGLCAAIDSIMHSWKDSVTQ